MGYIFTTKVRQIIEELFEYQEWAGQTAVRESSPKMVPVEGDRDYECQSSHTVRAGNAARRANVYEVWMQAGNVATDQEEEIAPADGWSNLGYH